MQSLPGAGSRGIKNIFQWQKRVGHPIRVRRKGNTINGFLYKDFVLTANSLHISGLDNACTPLYLYIINNDTSFVSSTLEVLFSIRNDSFHMISLDCKLCAETFC